MALNDSLTVFFFSTPPPFARLIGASRLAGYGHLPFLCASRTKGRRGCALAEGRPAAPLPGSRH